MQLQEANIRDKFLLRLMCAKFSHLFSMARPVVGRSIVNGIDTYLMDVYGSAYDEIDQNMEDVLKDMAGVPDQDIWRYIYDNDMRYHAPVRLMLALLMPFSDFDVAIARFMDSINAEIPADTDFVLTEERFFILFAIWFADLFAFAATGGPRFTVLYGEDTILQIRNIQREFLRRAPADAASMAGMFDSLP